MGVKLGRDLPIPTRCQFHSKADDRPDPLRSGTNNMLKIAGIYLATGLVLLSGPTWAQGSPAKGCFVAHFKSLALKTHNPQLRAELAEKWLRQNTPSCTQAQLSSMQANSPNWLGTALTHDISSILEGAIEASIAGNPELMGRLYESVGKEGQSGSVTMTNPVARAPVVQPMVNNGVISGSANYGTISGNTNVNQTTNNLSNANSNANTAASSTVTDSPNTTIGQGSAATAATGRASAPR